MVAALGGEEDVGEIAEAFAAEARGRVAPTDRGAPDVKPLTRTGEETLGTSASWPRRTGSTWHDRPRESAGLRPVRRLGALRRPEGRASGSGQRRRREAEVATWR